MSREIKFRFYNQLNSEKWSIYEKPLEDVESNDTLKSNAVCQFTGLLDKHGVEIYEGDIVKITELYLDDDWFEILEVRYASNGYHLYEKDSVGWRATLSRYEEKFRVEVIGNIYENSELLTPPKETP